jgi:hypothetical protein
VLIYRGEVECAAKEETVRAVIEAEKPAHTVYHLCVVQPAMQIGLQSRLGIDTVVGGPAVPTRLGGADGPGLVLAGDPPPVIGQSLVGETARL